MKKGAADDIVIRFLCLGNRYTVDQIPVHVVGEDEVEDILVIPGGFIDYLLQKVRGHELQ